MINCPCFEFPWFSHLETGSSEPGSCFHQLCLCWHTNKSYRAHKWSYLALCTCMNYNPVPITSEVACHYVNFVVRSSIQFFHYIREYLNISRIFNSAWKMPSPTLDNYDLQCAMEGNKCMFGASTICKTAITLYQCWPISTASHWGLCCFGCNAHDLPQHAASGQHPVEGIILAITFATSHWVIYAGNLSGWMWLWTMMIPLPHVPGSILCPAQAQALYLQRTNVMQHVLCPFQFPSVSHVLMHAFTSPIFSMFNLP